MKKLFVLVFALPAALAAQQPATPPTPPADTAASLPKFDTTLLGPIDTTARPISLDKAVHLAQRASPLAVAARGTIETSQAQVRAGYAAFIPSLSVSASASRQGGDRFDPQGALVPFTGNAWQQSHGLALNLDLFDGGTRIYNLHTFKANVTAANANEVLQQFSIALSVKQQFYAVLAAREADAAAESQLQESNENLKQALAKVRAREATKSDSLRAVIQVANAQLAIVTARYDLDNANAALTRLVGTTFTVTAAPDDSTKEFAFASVDSAALRALAEVGPAVRQAQASDVASAAGAKAARAPYLPSLSASWNISGNGSTNSMAFVADQYAYQNQFRISLSYPLFDQLQREQSIAVADVAQRNADAQLRDAKLAAQQNFVQFYGALRTNQQQVEIDQTSVEAAQEDLRVQRQRYDFGASTQLDVLTSEAALIQARAALIQARFNYRVAKAQLEALVGREL
ncbi:MAG TPA: TolC family protein [Gemmatimonadaceae bacterium]|nr:TolC family protein [Gemmatimonadaceae bacterium]